MIYKFQTFINITGTVTIAAGFFISKAQILCLFFRNKTFSQQLLW
tara:strand:+ start:2439 stop:2573 length:135 start_codon:yes stop_codon:yes gene_type:complete